MATIGTSRLKIVNDQPSIDKLENGRYRLEFFCSNDGKKTDWYADNIDLIFPAFGALQSDAFAAGTWVAPSGSVYSDMRLVEAGTQYVPAANQHYVKLVYETITASYAQIKDDTVDYELNGLRSVSRPSIAIAGTAYTGVVGVTTIAHNDPDGSGTVTLYLASYKIDENDAAWVVTENWREAGQISISEVQGPDGLPNTKTVTYTSQITEPASSGILLSKDIDNTGGYKVYKYKYLEGPTLGTTPIGVLQSYEQIIEVRKAGSITATGGSSSTLPYLTSIPPRIGKVKATVSIVLTDVNTVSVPVAYNLSDISCSATTVNTRVTPVGIEQGGALTIAVYNTRQTTSHQPFSNYYATNGGDSGSITTAASIIRDNDNIIGTTLNETASSVITITGSTTVPATTGVYDQILDPVFIDALGDQYYRKTTYTI